MQGNQKTRLFATVLIPKINLVNCKCVKTVAGNKAVENRFSCAFPIFKTIFKKLWIFPQNESLLKRRNLQRPSKTSSWALQLTTPKQEFILGAISYCAQKGIFFGLRDFRRPTKHILHCLNPNQAGGGGGKYAP